MTEFEGFGKIARLTRLCTITEKIDGTNAQIYIGEDGEFLTGSRNRWITPENDNMGFSEWAHGHKEELLELGPGRHFGEWWGCGIQRRYGLPEKRFSLFNTYRYADNRPACCHVVPILATGVFNSETIAETLALLALHGSQAAPGYSDPEGIVIYHEAANMYFKKTLKNDESYKGVLES
jgi:hypothetical protein